MDTKLFFASDINGEPLRLGSQVISSQFSGKGEVIAYLDVDDGRFGALIRVHTSQGQTLDLRIKLGQVKAVIRKEPNERTTDQKYGI